MKIYKYIFIFIFLLFGIIYAQNKKYIDIRDFNGVFTNADLEDIPKENFVELKNLRPVNGKLVKTFGFGTYGYDAVSDVDNIITYTEDNLTNPDDYAYVAYIIKNDTVQVKHWNTSSTDWENYNLSETFYHKNAQNPIIQEGGIIRFLPGNVDTVGLDNEPKGIWYGYIDREFFDSLYTPTAKFVSHVTTPLTPNYDIVVSQYDTGSITTDSYYKFSYTYDGIQEGLLSDGISTDIKSTGEFLKFTFYIVKANHTWRQTGLNIYRSDAVDGTYNKLYTIDYLREKGTAVSGDSAYNGRHYMYVPDLSDYNFSASYIYRLRVGFGGAGLVRLPEYSGTGHKFFQDTTGSLTITKWNDSWALYRYTLGDVFVDGVRGNNEGGFAGENIVAFDTSADITNIGDGILYYWTENSDSTIIMEIQASEGNAVLHRGDSLAYDSLRSWRVLNVPDGLYYAEVVGDSVKYEFFDTGLTEGAEHPLAGEISIKVNGKYARIIGKRLWQGNVILDPESEREKHIDWVSYSELEQYDVNPVSNIISFANEGIGGITGIAELFGNPVIMKKNNISMINIKDYPNTPANWNIIESVHNVGNIADNGYITVLGRLYVPYYDGIYEFSPNDLAESATTPSRRLKITEPIEDTYLALTLAEKEAIISEYNQNYNEIIFLLGTEVWAYNINKTYWREIDITNFTPTVFCLDDTAHAIAYNSYDSKLYYTGRTGNARAFLKSKTFLVSDERKDVIRYLWLNCKGGTSADLQLKLYLDDDTSPAETHLIQTVDSLYVQKISFSSRAKKFNFELLNPAYSEYETEIHRIRIEYEGDQ